MSGYDELGKKKGDEFVTINFNTVLGIVRLFKSVIDYDNVKVLARSNHYYQRAVSELIRNTDDNLNRTTAMLHTKQYASAVRDNQLPSGQFTQISLEL